MTSGEQPLEGFAAQLPYPLVIVGQDDPNQFLLNQAAENWLDELQIPDGSWQVIDPMTYPAANAKQHILTSVEKV